MRTVVFLAVLGAAIPSEARAESAMSAIGRILSDGMFAQFRYPTGARDGWMPVRADTVDRGFEVASFLLRKDICIRKRRDGTCRFQRTKYVELVVFDRKGMSLKEASRILGMLWGTRRIRNVRGEYRLTRRNRRGRFSEMLLFGHPDRSRFLFGVRTRHPNPADRAVGKRFLDAMAFSITRPRQ